MQMKNDKPIKRIKTVHNTAHYPWRQMDLHVQVQPYRTDWQKIYVQGVYLKKETFYSEIASWKYKHLAETGGTGFFYFKDRPKK